MNLEVLIGAGALLVSILGAVIASSWSIATKLGDIRATMATKSDLDKIERRLEKQEQKVNHLELLEQLRSIGRLVDANQANPPPAV